MKSVFYIKLNNKIQKIREETMPPDCPTNVAEIRVLMSFSFGDTLTRSAPRFVSFKRIVTESLDGVIMFMFDADSMPVVHNPGGIPGVIS